MKKLPLLTTLLLAGICVTAQVDTLNYLSGKMNTKAFKNSNASYVVFWTDSLGKHITSGDIWTRSVTITTTESKPQYTFQWKWWKKDTLMADITSIGDATSLTPISHNANYKSWGNFRYEFANNRVTVAEGFKKNAKDSAYNLELTPPGFTFPMDLELLPLVPMKKIGQEFAIAFYEPGSAQSKYYKLTVTGKEDLKLPGNEKVKCWILRLDYSPGSYSTFWISEETKEVIRMKEFFKGRWRNKVRLY